MRIYLRRYEDYVVRLRSRQARVFVALLFFGCVFGTESAAGTHQVLERAELILDEGPAPPPPNVRGQVVALPDDWRERRGGIGGVGWYRMSFLADLETATEPWAVFLPSVNMNAEVFVNGVSIGRCGRFDEPVAHCFNRPMLFRIPSSLLVEGANEIDVRLFAYAHHYGRLDLVEVGLESEILPEFERRFMLQVTLAQVATAVVMLVSAFVFALWIASGFDGAYGWFVVAALAWTVGSLNYWVRDLPVPHWSWERVVHPSLDLFLVALTPWVHRLLALRRSRIDATAGLTGLSSIALAAFVSVESFYPTVTWMHLVSISWAVYPVYLVFRRGGVGRLGPVEKAVYGAVGILALAFGLHDIAIQFGLAPNSIYLIPYIVPLILPTLGTTLTRRFVAARRDAAAAARELEERIEVRERELAQNYDALQRLERERAASEERQRLTREMHDGLGGHLISTLSLVEAGDIDDAGIAEALRVAVEDMRLMLESVDLDTATLTEVFGLARERLEPAVRRHGIAFRWRVPLQLARDLPLGPEKGTHILRILQESVANAIRHSGASEIAIAVSERDGSLLLDVVDDGRGFTLGDASGRGLRNMRDRAKRLGAEIRVEADREGTRVSLEVDWSRLG